MSTEYPVKFKIYGDELGDICHLKECTCDELLQQAKLQLEQNEYQLKNTQITIQDDQEIKFESDDEGLEDAFQDLDDDKEYLSLNIILTGGMSYIFCHIMHHKSHHTYLTHTIFCNSRSQ